MKYTYEFSDEENTIEINKYWSDVLIDLDKAESANQKKESRRHYHLEACIYDGIDFVDNNDKIEAMFKEPSKTDLLHTAISKLKIFGKTVRFAPQNVRIVKGFIFKLFAP